MGMILRIASSRIVGQGDIVGRSGYFSLNLSANSVMRGRLDARRTLKSLVADLRLKDLSARLAKIECNQPEVAKVPYSPVVGVPTCVAAQYGFGFGLNSWNGFNGWG